MRGMRGLAIVVAVVCMAGCDQRSSAAVAPLASSRVPVPATSRDPSMAPGVSSSAETVPGPWVYRPTTPIPGITAASLAERWSEHWGVTLTVTLSVAVQQWMNTIAGQLTTTIQNAIADTEAAYPGMNIRSPPQTRRSTATVPAIRVSI